MNDIPAGDLRTNHGTFAVGTGRIPAVTQIMTQSLPLEPFDPRFVGQRLDTTYFDTTNFALRKARQRTHDYITMRVRGYDGKTWAFSAKIEAHKFRLEIEPALALAYLAEGISVASLPAETPPPFVTRLIDLIGSDATVPVVAISFRRFAVEDKKDRLTLDTCIRTDNCKRLSATILEAKSTKDKDSDNICHAFFELGLRPIKLSKFLWATAIN